MLLQVDKSPHTDVLGKLTADWEDLARRVTNWQPGVVILVARKPPRVRQALGLQLSCSALILSDLAIPFSRRYLAGARVAIVDDVVNVGSTINKVARRLDEVGADEVKVFAVGQVDRDNEIGHLAAEYVYEHALDPASHIDLAGRVPDALQTLARPYDLDFPIIPSRLEFPLDSFSDLCDAMVEHHGEDRIWDLTTAIGAEHGVRRLAVDLSTERGGNRKIRFYLDERTGVLNVMPICIADTLSVEPPEGWRAGEILWTALADEPPAEDREARSRLRLFVDSLALGANFVADHRELLQLTEPSVFDVDDAELVLGPLVRRAARRIEAEDAIDTVPPLPIANRPTELSPFAEEARRCNFVDAVESRAAGRDPLSIFLAVFDELALVMGADDPGDYRWSWPYTSEEVTADSYRRLRVGPTAADLTDILHTASDGDRPIGVTRRIAMRLLDHFIDTGSVVPTIAEYPASEGGGVRTYRVYRRGENGGRVEFAEKVRIAKELYKGDVSRTRTAKIITTLAFGDGNDPLLEVQALPRGNVLCFRSGLFEDDADVTAWMRDTGRDGGARDSRDGDAPNPPVP